MVEFAEVLTTAQMRAIESAAIASGQVTGLELMERAGRALAGQIRLRWPRPGHATVLCGPGNNGGDGYVVARHLRQAGWRLRVLGLDNSPGPDAAGMKRRWRAIGPIHPLGMDAFGPDSDVYVDAVFGLGLTRPPEGEIGRLLARLGGSGGDRQHFRDRIVAVDCPSGLCLDSGGFVGKPRGGDVFDLQARLTVAFDSPKPGHLLERGPGCCGELVIADIGLRPWRERRAQGPIRVTALWPRFAIPDSRAAVAPLQSLAKQGGHKFDHGHALIVAGAAGHGGAARLAARAALRIGAGLVTIAPPATALAEHAARPDALMRRALDSDTDLRSALSDRRLTAVALGPGCGIDRARALIDPLLTAGRACVLDADALSALATRGFDGLHDHCILTPHGGEFARLFPDLADRLTATPQRAPLCSRLDAAQEAAARCGAVVLLKGPDTVIAAPDGSAVLHSAPDLPWLATAGAGDVLAGIITGLLARGFQPLDAAGLGVVAHAQAARRFGPGLIADDLPDLIPAVLRDMLRAAAPGA